MNQPNQNCPNEYQKQNLDFIWNFSMREVIDRLANAGVDRCFAIFCCQELMKYYFIHSRHPDEWALPSEAVVRATTEAVGCGVEFRANLFKHLGVKALRAGTLREAGLTEEIRNRLLKNYQLFLSHYQHYFGEPPELIWPKKIELREGMVFSSYPDRDVDIPW